MDSTSKIIFFSKKGCSPCEFFFYVFKRMFREDSYKKVIVETNEDALNISRKYNTNHFPFVVINERSILHKDDLKVLLAALFSKNT